MKKNVLSLSIAAMIGGLSFPTPVIGNTTVIGALPSGTVRVRFRSAGHSDDILDFSVFLSPGETWTAAVSEAARCDLPTLFNPHTSPLGHSYFRRSA